MALRYAYLENTSSGHNKFYEMTENPGGKTWQAKWGKIGTAGTTKNYPMSDWYDKFDEKKKKGYVDVTNTSSRSNIPKSAPGSSSKYKLNKEHYDKVNKVYLLIVNNKDKFVDGEEIVRDVGAIRKTLKDEKSPFNGSLSKQDMIYLNEVWKKIKNLENSAKK